MQLTKPRITPLPESEWNDETNLRAYSDDLRLEAADPIAGAMVATYLLIELPYGTNLNVLAEELRCAPVEV